MPDDLTIRQATADDLASLKALYLHLNPDDPAPDPAEAPRILEQLERYAGSAVLVGLCDGTPVTSCTLIVIPNLTRGGVPYALIENVVTHAQHRKRGFGKAVLEAALDRAWAHGCYKAMLLTGSTDPATHSFYKGVGFEQNKTGYQVRRLPVRDG